MKSIPISYYFVIGLAVCLSGCTDDYRGTMSGQVRGYNFSIYGEATPAPLPDVHMEAHSLKTGKTLESTTDDQGNYFFDDVQFGLNEVKAIRDKYAVVTKYADIEKNNNTELNFVLTETPYSTDVNLFVHVFTQDGEPIADAPVDVFRISKGEYGYTDVSEIYLGYDRTDEKGFAVFFGVAVINEYNVANFAVRVAAFGYKSAEQKFVLSYGYSTKDITIVLEPYE